MTPPVRPAPSGPRALLPLLAAAALVALLSGCFGVPPGTADTGDAVRIRYTAYDLETGAVLRQNQTAVFAIGSGDSGLGSQVERAVRGHKANDTFTVTVRDDPALDYSGVIEANRTLQPIPIEQSAPRADFERFVGPASVGQTFPAYGIYDGVVTGVTNDTVLFRIEAEEGQEDPAPSVGSVLVTTVGATHLERKLRPEVGATFSVSPPSQAQPQTPLGLEPGSYRVVGSTDAAIQLAKSSGAPDLVGKDLRVEVTLLQVQEAVKPTPTSGNFGERQSPQVNGDPSSILGQPLPTARADDGHGHTH